MSFLNQLKSQASALKQEQSALQGHLAESTAQTEAACRRAWSYLDDLAKQLNVIEPEGPRLSLDGKTPWPPMRLRGFRMDARKKMLRNQEVYDYVGLWWRVLPAAGNPVAAEVSVNFPPDLQRVETRLSVGHIPHERKEIRHPEKNSLLAIKFLFQTETRGSVNLTADHDKGQVLFRISNARGFDIVERTLAADAVSPAMLDELAKLMLGQPNRFA